MSKPVVHFEIGCADTAKASAFYGPLFGWSTTQMGPALMIQTGAKREFRATSPRSATIRTIT